MRRALQYGIAVKYDPELPEARALPSSLKEKLQGYEAADAIIAKVKAFVSQLSAQMVY